MSLIRYNTLDSGQCFPVSKRESVQLSLPAFLLLFQVDKKPGDFRGRSSPLFWADMSFLKITSAVREHMFSSGGDNLHPNTTVRQGGTLLLAVLYRREEFGCSSFISQAIMCKFDAGDNFMVSVISNVGEESFIGVKDLRNKPLRQQAPPTTGLLPSCCLAWPPSVWS